MQQTNILFSMQQKGFNVVTCGDCGDVMLLENGVNRNEFDSELHGMVKCPHCGFEDDESSFPDLFHEGWELSGNQK